MTRTALGFYEGDEDPRHIEAAFERGEKRTTVLPVFQSEEFIRGLANGVIYMKIEPGTDRPLLTVLPDPLEDLSDCRHGCNGDCVESGSDDCNFTCHP